MKNTGYSVILSTICVLLFCTCKGNTDKDIVEKTIGLTVSFPENVEVKVSGNDTVLPFPSSAKAKILIYIDSVGCSPCRMNLPTLTHRINDLQKSGLTNVPFLIFAFSNNYPYLEKNIYLAKFDYPIYYDRTDELNKLNHFPKDPRFNAFLLDKENKIVLVGNPVENDVLWNLYKEQIKKLLSQ